MNEGPDEISSTCRDVDVLHKAAKNKYSLAQVYNILRLADILMDPHVERLFTDDTDENNTKNLFKTEMEIALNDPFIDIYILKEKAQSAFTTIHRTTESLYHYPDYKKLFLMSDFPTLTESNEDNSDLSYMESNEDDAEQPKTKVKVHPVYLGKKDSNLMYTVKLPHGVNNTLWNQILPNHPLQNIELPIIVEKHKEEILKCIYKTPPLPLNHIWSFLIIDYIQHSEILNLQESYIKCALHIFAENLKQKFQLFEKNNLKNKGKEKFEIPTAGFLQFLGQLNAKNPLITQTFHNYLYVVKKVASSPHNKMPLEQLAPVVSAPLVEVLQLKELLPSKSINIHFKFCTQMMISLLESTYFNKSYESENYVALNQDNFEKKLQKFIKKHRKNSKPLSSEGKNSIFGSSGSSASTSTSASTSPRIHSSALLSPRASVSSTLRISDSNLPTFTRNNSPPKEANTKKRTKSHNAYTKSYTPTYEHQQQQCQTQFSQLSIHENKEIEEKKQKNQNDAEIQSTSSSKIAFNISKTT